MISTYVGDKLSKGQKTYFIDSYSSISVLSGPLALPSYKWLAEMLRQSGNDWAEEAAAKLDQMKSLAILPYEITERTDEILTLRNIKDEKMLMKTDTMDPTVAVTTKQGEIIVSSLMFFDGYWHVNGMCTISQPNSTFDTDVEFHLKKEQMTKENYQTVLNNNGGSPIGVAKDWDELSSLLKLDNADDNTENAAIAKRAKTMRNILYFINKDGNISILPDAAPLVKLPGNELYDPELATKQSCTLLFNLQASREMRAYLIDNKLLPDARLAGPLPDSEAKPWFAENEAFLEQAVNTDEAQISIP